MYNTNKPSGIFTPTRHIITAAHIAGLIIAVILTFLVSGFIPAFLKWLTTVQNDGNMGWLIFFTILVLIALLISSFIGGYYAHKTYIERQQQKAEGYGDIL
jgi:uncharacterized protein YacL